jgi:uncharacterized protein (DUF2062 family)
MTDPQAADSPQQTKGRLRDRLKRIILHPEMTPEQVALSFAIGFSISWNPLIGIHTVLILALCLLFRKLHRPLMLLACYINNPWTMLPMASASGLVGNLLLGRGCRVNFRGVRWHALGWRSFLTSEGFDHMYIMLKPVLVPYLLGGIVMSLLALPVGYYVMLKLTRHLRARPLHLPPLRLPPIHHAKSKPDQPGPDPHE